MQPDRRRSARTNCSCGLLRRVENREVADQRQMIRELHIRNFEAIHANLGAVQDEIQLLAGTAAGIRKQPFGIGAAKVRRLREQIQFVLAPIVVEEWMMEGGIKWD